MKVFILEDDPGRIRWFRERFIGHDVTFIESCTEADKFQPPYDLILLDHDLGGRQMNEHEDCGLTFIKLIKNKLTAEDTLVVHSYNSVGATRMLKEIPHVLLKVYAPYRGVMFDTLMHNLEALEKMNENTDNPGPARETVGTQSSREGD